MCHPHTFKGQKRCRNWHTCQITQIKELWKHSSKILYNFTNGNAFESQFLTKTIKNSNYPTAQPGNNYCFEIYLTNSNIYHINIKSIKKIKFYNFFISSSKRPVISIIEAMSIPLSFIFFATSFLPFFYSYTSFCI